MWLIFSGASNVFAWLNLQRRATSNALETGRKMDVFEGRNATSGADQDSLEDTVDSTTPHSNWSPDADDPEALAKLYLTPNQKISATGIVNNEYFNRTWILPEILQAQRVVLIFGESRCDLSILSCFPKDGNARQWKAFGRPGESYADRLLKARDNVPPAASTDRTKLFMTTMSDYGQTQRSDPRDRIFAMIADPRVQCLGLRAALKPEYRLCVDEVALLVFAAFDAVCEPMKLDSFGDRKEEWREAMTKNIRLTLVVFTATALSCSWSPLASLNALRQTLLPLLEIREGVTRIRSTGEEINSSGPTMTWLLFSDPIPSREFFYDLSDLEPGKAFFIDCLERIIGRNPNLPISEANRRAANGESLYRVGRHSSGSVPSDEGPDPDEGDPWWATASWTSAGPKVRSKKQRHSDATRRS